MESILPFSFSDFPDDVQIRILSFFNPWELDSFARTATGFLSLCRDDERLWFLKCSRRWGSQTQVQNWGGRKISYRHLYHLLEKYENLIGFWNLDTYFWTIPPSLVCFEWGSFYITGYRISPSKSGGYGVTKKPFVWITATSNGKGLNYLDPGQSVLLTEKDLSREDSEKLRSELILVDIQVSVYDNGNLYMRENTQFFELRKRLSTRNGREEYESLYRTPPDGLMTRIYQILTGKPSTVTDGSKRQRARERQREKEKWQHVHIWGSQSFRKIIDFSPSPSRPLQGLWKGICPDRSLNLYLVYYLEEFDQISCVSVGGSSTLEYYREFRASSTSFIESPFSPEEESMYNSRVHVRPRAEAAPLDDHYLLRIFYADSSSSSNPSYLSGNSDDADGRIWLYTNETFGFGFLRGDFIVDLKPMIKNDCLLDLMI